MRGPHGPATAPERVAFALALQRLCAPGSDLQGAAWAKTVEAPGFEDLALHHFYRALPWLAAVRHELERDLFFQGRDLFSAALDLVFVDTTSVYLHRDAAGPLVRHGYSRDRRPELPQLVLCVAVDGQGWPVAFDILPGNTADTEALRLTIARFGEALTGEDAGGAMSREKFSSGAPTLWREAEGNTGWCVTASATSALRGHKTSCTRGSHLHGNREIHRLAVRARPPGRSASARPMAPIR